MKMLSVSVIALMISSAAVAAEKQSETFLKKAIQGNFAEVEMGKLAQQNGQSDEVKKFGQMLATDHANDFHQLYTAAQQANAKVPDAIDSKHNKAMIDPFQKLTGAAFDRRFSQEMVAGHTKAIAAYKNEAANGQNPALKAYAEQALPVLQKHLDQAKTLGKSK